MYLYYLSATHRFPPADLLEEARRRELISGPEVRDRLEDLMELIDPG